MPGDNATGGDNGGDNATKQQRVPQNKQRHSHCDTSLWHPSTTVADSTNPGQPPRTRSGRRLDPTRQLHRRHNTGRLHRHTKSTLVWRPLHEHSP